jgi:hypothetical protein
VFQSIPTFERDRTITLTIDGGPVDPADMDFNEEGWTHRFKMRAHHNKERKQLVATVIKCVTQESGSGFRVERYSPFEDVATIAVIPCPRYSDKALAAFWQSVLEMVEEIGSNEGDTRKAAQIIRMGQDFASAKA